VGANVKQSEKLQLIGMLVFAAAAAVSAARDYCTILELDFGHLAFCRLLYVNPK
jgi:hypothetical protein